MGFSDKQKKKASKAGIPDPRVGLHYSGHLAGAKKYLKDIEIQNLTLSLNGEDVISNSTLDLRHGRCYGIANSAGNQEDTLFRVMAERLLPFPSHYDVSCPVYEPEYGYLPVRKYVTSRESVIEQIEEGQALLASLGGGNSQAMTCLNARLKDLEESPDELAGHILYGLGFDKHMQSGRADNLHCSWHKPLALARTLFLRPHVLLLHEPIDYLDLERSLWLAHWIVNHVRDKCILIIKSNNEDFLNLVCTEFIHLENCEVQQFTGSYEEFLVSKLQSNAMVQADRLTFRPVVQQLDPPFLQLRKASFGYDGKDVLQNVDLDLTLGSRVAIVGNKGCGKSALLDALRGAQGLNLTGTRTYNANLSIGYYHSRLIEELDLNLSVSEYLSSVFPGNKNLIKETIEFAHPATMRKRMSTLSLGQKTLVVLACLASKEPHILLLDEPFKSLDIESMQSIARALQNWNGSFVLASHNVKLIESVASDIWVCGSLALANYKGGIIDLKLEIQERNNYLFDIQNPEFISGTYPQFSISSGDVAHPNMWYKAHTDDFDESFKSGCIPFAQFTKNRAMVSNAPCSGLKDGEMSFPHETDLDKSYRMITDPGRRIGRSLLGSVRYAELAGECFSDFSRKNVMVTPHGTIRLKGVKRKKLCPLQLRRNYMSVHKILTDMCSVGGAVPEEVQYLLDMIEFEPEMSEIYPGQSALVPICSIAQFFTRLYEHLLKFMTNTAIIEQILLEIPYVGTDQELMSIQHPATGPEIWHNLAQTNSIVLKTYAFQPGQFSLQPLPLLHPHLPITPLQLKRRRVKEATNFLHCLRHRVAHRMDYQDGLTFQYTAKASDLATHARFSKVSCVLQKELHKANQTKMLGLGEFTQEKV